VRGGLQRYADALGLADVRFVQEPGPDMTLGALRNVAMRQSFMHNGAFKKLRDVVSFYATRATSPLRWYKSGVKFDDVPEKYRDQVNINSIPYNRRPGDEPALTDEDVDALVAFLGTLTDAAYRNAVR